jgi:hypothetical protein
MNGTHARLCVAQLYTTDQHVFFGFANRKCDNGSSALSKTEREKIKTPVTPTGARALVLSVLLCVREAFPVRSGVYACPNTFTVTGPISETCAFLTDSTVGYVGRRVSTVSQPTKMTQNIVAIVERGRSDFVKHLNRVSGNAGRCAKKAAGNTSDTFVSARQLCAISLER